MRRALELLAAAVLCAGGARAGGADTVLAPVGGGALSLSADPPALVLGRDAAAELRIAAPPEVEELTVTANVGKVEAVRRSTGGFTARYRPPPERFPQVAIIAAVGRAGAVSLDGWVAVPLSGQGDARVPGKPGSQVSLRIGDQGFGPEPVGEDGIAVIPVVVPPGVRQAYRGFSAVELRLPETTLLGAIADRKTVEADRPETVRVFAYAVAPHGAARKGEPPLAETSRGTLVFRPREPGAYEGTWTIPPGPAGEERALVRLEGFPASRVLVRVTTVPGPAASLALSVDRSSLRAGDAEDVRVTARALDGAGNPAANPPVLWADAGSLLPEEGGPGMARARLHLEPRFGGRDRVLLSANVPGTQASAVEAVALLPGTPVRARLTPDRGTVRADGRSEEVLSFEAWDDFDNPAAGAPRAAASQGPAPVVEPEGPGRWQVRYRVEPVREPTDVKLSAELGVARSEAERWLVPPSSTQLALFASGGGQIGFAKGSSGGHLLLGAELPLGDVVALPPERALALRLEAAGMRSSREVSGGWETLNGATVLVGPVMKGVMRPGRYFASATAGFFLGAAQSPNRASSSGAGLALRLAAGLSAPLQSTAPFLELGYLAAGGPGGGVSALTLSVGVRFDLFREVGSERGD